MVLILFIFRYSLVKLIVVNEPIADSIIIFTPDDMDELKKGFNSLNNT